MGSPSLKELAYTFITTNRLAALATVSEAGTPHVAPVYCIVKEDLSIYFSTRVEGRKYTNLTQLPTVAMTFTDEVNVAAIQLTGSAERVEDLKLEQAILHDLVRLRHHDPNWPIPTLKLFESGATNELAIVRVTPTEMTYASFATPKTGKHSPFFQKVI